MSLEMRSPWIRQSKVKAKDGRAREAADRALSLEPDLAEAHALMVLIRMNDRDWRGDP
jgi:hypothetical protein